MASEILDVTGTSKWAKLTEDTRDRGSSVADGAKYDYPEACTVDLFMEPAELKKVTSVNKKANVNVGDDGMSIKFRRNWVNSRNPKWGGAPELVDADGNPFNKNPGDGSTLRLAVETYDTKYGKGMRILKVMVLDYVEPEFDEQEPELPF